MGRVMAEREFERQRNEDYLKRRRQMDAAAERQRRLEAGEPEEDPIEAEKRERREKNRMDRRKAMKKKGPWLKENWLMLVLGGLAVLYVVMNVLNFFTKDKKEEDDDKED